MKCPKCQNELRENVSLRRSIFKFKKIIIFFCPICEWENKKEFDISNKDYKIEELKLSEIPKAETKIRYIRENKNE